MAPRNSMRSRSQVELGLAVISCLTPLVVLTGFRTKIVRTPCITDTVVRTSVAHVAVSSAVAVYAAVGASCRCSSCSGHPTAGVFPLGEKNK